MNKRFDVIIIGGGNAGFGVSAVVSEAGRSIAFVEGRDFGGTCPNRGCTPKKVLVAAAHALHEIETAKVHGIEVGAPKLDWAKLIDREKEMISSLPEAMERLAKKRGDVYRERARFVGPNAIAVNGKILEAEHIVIATGSKPRALPIPGAEYLITSDEVLSERVLPGEVVFIGGGVIAMELSHVYARAGAKVKILEALPRLLPRMDGGAVEQVRKESERIGIEIRTGVDVKEITNADGKLRVRYLQNDSEVVVEADRVVNGAGRVANVADLDLEAGGVAHDGLRIDLDPYLRSTTNSRVWVAGDALVQTPQLSPLATYEGQVVGRNIVYGPSETPDYRVVPNLVFTVPALAAVGFTEDEARAEGLKAKVLVNDMTDWFSGLTYGETVAWAKVLVEEESGGILGAHLVGHRSEELIHIFALAMKHGITAGQLKEMVFGFPTFAADVKSLL